MMRFSELEKLALAAGFSCAAPLAMDTIELKPEVREMCASGNCAKYGTSWSCPPACGALEDCRARVAQCASGILVQTVGALEDVWDGEGMLAAEARHKESFRRLHAALRQKGAQVLALGAGCCTSCAACSYPDASCRRPQEMTSSMEAYGILVNEVCRRNGLRYYYGANAIAYTGCFLFREEGSAHGRSGDL